MTSNQSSTELKVNEVNMCEGIMKFIKYFQTAAGSTRGQQRISSLQTCCELNLCVIKSLSEPQFYFCLVWIRAGVHIEAAVQPKNGIKHTNECSVGLQFPRLRYADKNNNDLSETGDESFCGGLSNPYLLTRVNSKPIVSSTKPWHVSVRNSSGQQWEERLREVQAT